MTHDHGMRRIEAYLDNELGSAEAIDLLEHIETCRKCEDQLARVQRAKELIRSELMPSTAPDSLRRKILHSVAPDNAKQPSPWKFTWFGWSASVSIALVLGILGGVLLRPQSNSSRAAVSDLAQNVIEENIRTLKSGHLIDVVSNDRHTVKPWFAGKVDFSPIVMDLALQGYPLIGGRVEYFDGHDVAALVFKKGPHFLQLYEWPVEAGSHRENLSSKNPTERLTEEFRGYTIVWFEVNGLRCSVVSDASREEVAAFAKQFMGEARK